MVILRNMTEAQVTFVAELEKKIFSDAWTARSIMETLEQPQTQIVVGEEDGKVIGYAIVYFVLDEAELTRIAVDENCRGKGVGHQLMEAVLEICRDKEIAKLFLEVRESNHIARMFYQKHGFNEDGVRKNFYQFPTEHAILMSKTMPVLPTGREKLPTL